MGAPSRHGMTLIGEGDDILLYLDGKRTYMILVEAGGQFHTHKGYVELDEGIRVEVPLTESDPEKLEIGMPMELVIEKFDEDEDGNDRMMFAFQPVAS